MKKSLTAVLCAALCGVLLFSLSSCFLLKPLSSTDPDEVYGKLLEEYAILAKARSEGEDIAARNSPATKGLSRKLFDSLKAVVSEAEYADAAVLGYAFRDLDGDGTYECFLMKNDGTLYALFAMKNGTPYLVESYVTDPCVQGVLLEDGSIYTHKIFREDGKILASRHDYSYFADGGMEASRTYHVDYKADSAYAVEYGVRRDFADKEIHHINDQATSMHNNYEILAKKSGLWFNSITEEGDHPDAPAFDGSSYDAILNSVTAMMPHIRGFVYKEWRSGAYDHLMAIDSPEEFRLYNDLLYACGMHGGYGDVEGNQYVLDIGYAYKDLNGDGTDELFLLNEKSDILAVFTLREDKPVLLWRADDNSGSAIDGQGHLITSKYANYNFTAIVYTAFELTPEGEWIEVAYLYGDQHVRKILKDGRITITDREEYSAEYNRVFIFMTTNWNAGGKVLEFHKLG